jgi:hypothetical protein
LALPERLLCAWVQAAEAPAPSAWRSESAWLGLHDAGCFAAGLLPARLLLGHLTRVLHTLLLPRHLLLLLPHGFAHLLNRGVEGGNNLFLFGLSRLPGLGSTKVFRNVLHHPRRVRDALAGTRFAPQLLRRPLGNLPRGALRLVQVVQFSLLIRAELPAGIAVPAAVNACCLLPYLRLHLAGELELAARVALGSAALL